MMLLIVTMTFAPVYRLCDIVICLITERLCVRTRILITLLAKEDSTIN